MLTVKTPGQKLIKVTPFYAYEFNIKNKIPLLYALIDVSILILILHYLIKPQAKFVTSQLQKCWSHTLYTRLET